MKKNVAWGLVASLVVVAMLAGGFAVASNMGFKFVPNVTANKVLNLSLPWNNNYNNANDLLVDTGATEVQRFDENSQLVGWSGSGTNFTVAKGEAYIIAAGASGLTPTIVGSHDPEHTISVGAGQVFNASAPYHQTFTLAGQLLTDLQAFNSGVSEVQKFDENSQLIGWSGSGTNFTLTLGEGVIISSTAAVSGYQWPHY